MEEGLESLVWQLHDVRKQKGLTIVQLSKISGVSTSVITHYEHGRASLKLDSFIRITKALNIKLYWEK